MVMAPNIESPIQLQLDDLLRGSTSEEDYRKATAFLDKLQTSEALTYYRYVMYGFTSSLQGDTSDEELEEMFNDYIEDGITVGVPPFADEESTFIQRGLAMTVWKAIFMLEAKDDYDYLFNHAYLVLTTRIESAAKVRTIYDYERRMHAALMGLPSKGLKEGKEIFEGLKLYSIGQPHAIEGSNLFNKLSSDITLEMMGLLLRLPHLETLRGAGNRNPGRN
jgi:hypothetical protein